MTTVSLQYAKTARYAAFVSGCTAANIALGQVAHYVPGAGPAWLPIYFFTILCAYRCGLLAGMATTLLSVIGSHLLFGMPAAAMLPVVLVKSAIIVASISATRHFVADRKVGILAALGIAALTIAASAAVCTAAHLLFADSPNALTATLTSLPGLLMQTALLTALMICS